jgi:hypothetical protein
LIHKSISHKQEVIHRREVSQIAVVIERSAVELTSRQ